MGFLTTVKGFFTKSNPVTGPVAKREAEPKGYGLNFLKYGFLSNKIWYCDPQRKAVHDDIENMDDNDEIVSQALDTIAEVAIGLEDGFTDKFSVKSEDEKALTVINQAVARLHLRRDAKDTIRKMVKHGNEFKEIVIGQDMDGAMKIMRLRGDMPSYTFYPNLDKHDNVILETPWVQKLGAHIFGKEVSFKPWQLVHWCYGERKYHTGTPMLKSARRNWKRLQMQEDTMALARMQRAYMKLLHYVPVSPRATQADQQEAIDNYRRNMEKKEFINWAQGRKESLDDPLTVESDIYLPEDGTKRGRVESVDPKNANLQNIDDVVYAQSKLISRLGVPRNYLNIEGAKSSSLNQGDGSGKADKHFSRKIRDVQFCFIEGIVFLLNIELMLHGIAPYDAKGNLIYEVGMSRVNTEDAYARAQAENTIADAATKWMSILEMPEEMLMEHFMRLPDTIMAKYKDKIKLRTSPNPAMQTGGMAGAEGGTPRGQRPASQIRKRNTEA